MSLPLHAIRKNLVAVNVERAIGTGIKSANLGSPTPKMTLPLIAFHMKPGGEKYMRTSMSTPMARKSSTSRSPRRAQGVMTFSPSPKNSTSPFDVSERDNIMRLKQIQEQEKPWHFDKMNKSTPSRLAPSAAWNSRLLSFEQPPPLTKNDLPNQHVAVSSPEAATSHKKSIQRSRLDVPKPSEANMQQFETSAGKPNTVTSCWVHTIDTSNVSISKTETQGSFSRRYGHLLTAPDKDMLFIFEKTPTTVHKEQKSIVSVLPPSAHRTSNTGRDSICGYITLTIPQSSKQKSTSTNK
eukprot:GEMP01043690.1.p1 GENE.GEMP01043690.1~~GEMP01043690.1.p1  ORF type:complete len:329 (+),score=20.49 GEMP01043690.1:102-989(+)